MLQIRKSLVKYDVLRLFGHGDRVEARAKSVGVYGERANLKCQVARPVSTISERLLNKRSCLLVFPDARFHVMACQQGAVLPNDSQ